MQILLIIMTLAIAINSLAFRNDSTVYPRIDISGYADTPFIKLADWQYFQAPKPSFLLEPNNRSLKDCPVILRNCVLDELGWSIDPSSPGFVIGFDGETNAFIRSGGTTDTWKGAYYDTPLTGDVITIQATATATDKSAGISFQNDGDLSHNYFDEEVVHGIIFGQNGQLSIWEKGEKPKNLIADFQYKIGDTAMIEIDSNLIVRYYLIKPDKSMELLRTTRSKLTTDPIAELMLFQTGASLSHPFICSGPEEVATFENIAVATIGKGLNDWEKKKVDWQRWKNNRNRISNAEPIRLADGEFEYTYPSSKRVLRSIALTPKVKNFEGFQALEDFYNYHGDTREFIFVDYARRDKYGNPQEFWAKFSGGMSDAPSNLCLDDYSTTVQEVYRSDFIPQVLDTTAPEIALDGTFISYVCTLTATATDDQDIRFVRFYNNGNLIFGLSVTSATDEFQVSFNYEFYESGLYTLKAVAYDYAGNTATSNSLTLEI